MPRDRPPCLVAGRIVTCLPIRYELLFSTRDADGFVALEARLAALRDTAVTASVQRAAMVAHRDLATLGPLHHRVPLPDPARRNDLSVLPPPRVIR